MMKTPEESRSEGGFALLLTLSLLALLVLILLALSALVKVDTQLATTSVYQTQARQNALIGLHQGLAALQGFARADDRTTGMAGVSGALARNTTRQWTGVWSGTNFIAWLASGSTNQAQPAVTGTKVTLVAAGSVANPPDKTDQEFVEVGLVDVPVIDRTGASSISGHMGYWVGDEGVKLSAVLVDAETPVLSAKHALASLTDISPIAQGITSIISYEQLTAVSAHNPTEPDPTKVETAAAKAGQLRTAFHSLTRTHYGFVSGNALKAGLLNINSTSARYWTAVGETYNLLRPNGALSITAPSFGTGMAALMLSNGPFASASDLLNSPGLATVINASGGGLLDFKITMQNWFTNRSDTFRVRAYGDAVNATIDSSQPVAKAYCEAIVQRIKDSTTPSGEGRFVITYFRWLAPNDI